MLKISFRFCLLREYVQAFTTKVERQPRSLIAEVNIVYCNGARVDLETYKSEWETNTCPWENEVCCGYQHGVLAQSLLNGSSLAESAQCSHPWLNCHQNQAHKMAFITQVSLCFQQLEHIVSEVSASLLLEKIKVL